jgi:hypothetical protein
MAGENGQILVRAQCHLCAGPASYMPTSAGKCSKSTGDIYLFTSSISFFFPFGGIFILLATSASLIYSS